eukprot:NODE_3328_length_1371_cov_95.973558_g2894_i0.p1 GENE.NODE_3328_length_1371_cov_95.973558_g2894_i0~~NODE_3328_length_1371_cov_95.973558_g2894_i0.p1  ORF type:complete len:433 (-),score=94.27 NODE_3328_length_1371_cov_95.973558_g2894_i0:73-1308(-)
MFRRVIKQASSALVQKRFLNVHEYIGKDLMGQYSIDHQRGITIDNLDHVTEATKKLPSQWYIVKSQVLAGGRGKGTFNTGFKGGVKLAKNTEEAVKYSKEMLGNTLFTHQTGPKGQTVRKLFIAECLDISKEYYFAILLRDKPYLVGSSRGGVDIEDVAKNHPEDIVTRAVDINTGLTLEDAKSFAAAIGFKGDYLNKAAHSIVQLYKLGVDKDATVIEINPFAETPDGRVVCIDAKFNFDDNASYRQKSIFALRDIEQEDPKEVAAEKFGLNYIALDGNIACLVNGAGLAMATMDIIQQHGGKPANFLDVGGGATKEAVTAAFKIINSDPNVKGILVNIFGGIMRCDTIAEGLVAASQAVGVSVPVVVRLAGTNQERGNQILKESGLALISANDLDDAASKIVSITKAKA